MSARAPRGPGPRGESLLSRAAGAPFWVWVASAVAICALFTGACMLLSERIHPTQPVPAAPSSGAAKTTD